MFSFIHTYTDESFEGLQKQGLWKKNDGLKVMHKNYMPEIKTFNNYAAEGSMLFNTLEQLRCPFYIDRLQGGILFPYEYDFDNNLINKYTEMLGDKFWGFQMHEWASNYRHDAFSVIDLLNKWKSEDNNIPVNQKWKKEIENAKTCSSDLSVESCSVEEWSKMQPPESYDEFIRKLYQLWAVRRQAIGYSLIPADSYYMAPKIEIAGGKNTSS